MPLVELQNFDLLFELFCSLEEQCRGCSLLRDKCCTTSLYRIVSAPLWCQSYSLVWHPQIAREILNYFIALYSTIRVCPGSLAQGFNLTFLVGKSSTEQLLQAYTVSVIDQQRQILCATLLTATSNNWKVESWVPSRGLLGCWLLSLKLYDLRIDLKFFWFKNIQIFEKLLGCVSPVHTCACFIHQIHNWKNITKAEQTTQNPQLNS